MFETSMMLTISDWALKRTGKLHGERRSLCWKYQGFDRCASEHEPAMWDGLQGHFTEHVDAINEDLKSKGLPLLGSAKKA
jgi:homogentisate 1,2-dioxygenase